MTVLHVILVVTLAFLCAVLAVISRRDHADNQDWRDL